MSAEITTSRDELFTRLILHTPHGFVEYDGPHGKGRRYHLTLHDLLDAFWRFCDEKEHAATADGSSTNQAEAVADASQGSPAGSAGEGMNGGEGT